jgi:predicted dehydrogenase
MNITRREFTWLIGAGIASQALPVALAQAPDRKIGYCIVGLGRIASHFMPGILASGKARITGVVSGHRDKAERIATQYGVPKSAIYNYQNYDEIAHNPDIEAVYIALPNGMHAEYTIRAAQAGKHVLCEKPMSTSVADAQAMIDACHKADKKLMIAYRCHYEPTNLRAVQLIRDGSLGQVKAIESAFGFNISPGEWRLDKKLAGGGPLMDVGIYSLNACRYLTGEEPTWLSATSSVIDHDGRFKDVEENISWSMKFPSGIVASCNTTYGAPMQGFYRVHGSKGVLQVDDAFSYEGLRLTAKFDERSSDKSSANQRPPIDEPNLERDPSHFVREADHFAGCILENKQPKSPGEEGLRDMKLMMEIYESCKKNA